MRKNLPVVVVLIYLFSLVISSCAKDEGPCDATITVIDANNRSVAGAKVVLRQDSVINPNTGVKADIHQEKITDGAGRASFTFDKEAVLNVEVTKDTLYGRDYIRLEPAANTEKTVRIL